MIQFKGNSIKILCGVLVFFIGQAVFVTPAQEYLKELGLQVLNNPIPAQDFSLETLEGKTVSLTDYRGRPVLLYFWTTW